MTSPKEISGRRLRAVLITRNLPPELGGMQKLSQHLALELAEQFEVLVVGPHGCRPFLTENIAVHEVSERPLWRFFFGVLIATVTTVRRLRPDIVIGGSGLAAPFAWLAARLADSRMIIYLHGLDLLTESFIYRRFWRPFIRRADLCIANSHNTAELARSIGVQDSRMEIVHPGVEIPSPRNAAANNFRSRFDFGDRPLLLSVGRLIARKGLLEFVENSLPEIVSNFPDVCLVVLGDETPQLLHGDSSGLGDLIRQRANDLGVASNLRFIGPQDDAVLACAYYAADVHVFPVREVAGDVEGFGMVALEAAAHGLQTVAFAVGGVPDAVREGVSGFLAPANDYASMSTKIIGLLRERNDPGLRCRARDFASGFSWQGFGTLIREKILRCGSPRRNNAE